jgi:hypothetical protein
MPQVYFNIGRTNRNVNGSPYDFDTAAPIMPETTELVEVALNLPTAQLTDPTRSCRMELYRSVDGIAWQFMGSATFVGAADNTGAPSVGVDGVFLRGFFFRGRIVILGATMNVGFQIQARQQNF